MPLSGWKPLSWASISRESSLAAIFFNYRSFHNTRALHQSSNKYDHPFLAYVASREKVKDVCHFLLDRLNVTLRILAEPLPMLEYEIEKSRGGIKQDGCEMGPFIRIRRGSRMAHSAKLIKKYTRWPTSAFNINLLVAARSVLRCPLRRGWECRTNEGWSAGNGYGRRQRGNKNGEDDRKIREGEPRRRARDGEKGRIGIVYKGGGAGSSRGISRQSPCLQGLKESRRWNASQGCLTEDEIIVKTRLPRRLAMIIFYILLPLTFSVHYRILSFQNSLMNII